VYKTIEMDSKAHIGHLSKHQTFKLSIYKLYSYIVLFLISIICL